MKTQNTIKNKSKGLLKSAILIPMATLVMAQTALGQSTVNINAKSEASEGNGYGRITVMNTTTLEKQSKLTDPATGNASFILQDGQLFKISTEIPFNYLKESFMSINGPMDITSVVLADTTKNSSSYGTFLDLFKGVTGTDQAYTKTHRMSANLIDNIPKTRNINYFIRPADPNDSLSATPLLEDYLTRVLSDIGLRAATRMGSTLMTSDVTEGISMVYPSSTNPVLEGKWTRMTTPSYNSDGSIKKAVLYLARDIPDAIGQYNASRLIMQALLGDTLASKDPTHVSHDPSLTYTGTDGRVTFDEARVLRYLYSLDEGTDMSEHKNVVVSPDVLPIQLESIVANLTGDHKVDLVWRTVSEVNNYGFEVQESVNNTEFFPVNNGFVPGHGTTIVPNSYKFEVQDSLNNLENYFFRLKQIDLDGTFNFTEGIKPVRVNSVEDHNLPFRFSLEQNYPNPFNPSTNIEYTMPKSSNVRINVANVLGQIVRELSYDNVEPGRHQVVFDAKGLPSGTYFYRINALPKDGKGNYFDTKKMLLLK